MEAPDKIYLQCCGDCPQTDCDGCKFEDLEDNVTWYKDRYIKAHYSDAIVYDYYSGNTCKG